MGKFPVAFGEICFQFVNKYFEGKVIQRLGLGGVGIRVILTPAVIWHWGCRPGYSKITLWWDMGKESTSRTVQRSWPVTAPKLLQNIIIVGFFLSVCWSFLIAFQFSPGYRAMFQRKENGFIYIQDYFVVEQRVSSRMIDS